MILMSIAPILAAAGVRWERGDMPLLSMALASIPVLIAWVICVRLIAKMEDEP